MPGQATKRTRTEKRPEPQYAIDGPLPANVGAERTVLGSVLLNTDIIHEVVAAGIQDAFFHHGPHRLIFRAMRDLAAGNQPIDLITVSEQLSRAKLIEAVGGVAYISSLSDGVPNRPSVANYTAMLRECYQRREVIHAANKAIAMVMEPAQDVTECIGGLTDELFAMKADTITHPARQIGEIAEETLPEIWEQMHASREIIGLPFGVPEFDLSTTGIRDGEVVILAGYPGSGKALALDTLLPTPHGWTTMGCVAAGDLLVDDTGRPCKVLRCSEVMYNHDVFEVEFDDGSVLCADADHIWQTSTRRERQRVLRTTPEWRNRRRAKRPKTGTGKRPWMVKSNADRAAAYVSTLPTSGLRTTREIAQTLTADEGRVNHSVAVAVVQGEEIPLPVPPYVLGAWLGDGCNATSRFTSADEAVVESIEQCGYKVTKEKQKYSYYIRSLTPQLRALGLLHDKHIPAPYLRSSVEQRLELLRGLMDTDGTADAKNKGCEFSVKCERLAKDTQELLCSLGIKAPMSTGRSMLNGRDYGTRFRLPFSTSLPVFNLERKALKQAKKSRSTQYQRYIVAVRPVRSVPVKCVAVDSPSHLYLAGRSFIPTHNTAFITQVLFDNARAGAPTELYSLEMKQSAVARRVFSNYTGVSATLVRNPRHLGMQDYRTMEQSIPYLKEIPFWIDDRCGQDITEIVARARINIRKKGLKAVGIDFLQMVNGRGENRNEQLCYAMKLIADTAKDTNVPFVVLSQLSRPEGRDPNVIPNMFMLRDSGGIEQFAHLIAFTFRPQDENRQPTGDDKLVIGKQREGMTGPVPALFNTRCLRWEERKEAAAPPPEQQQSLGLGDTKKTKSKKGSGKNVGVNENAGTENQSQSEGPGQQDSQTGD